MGCNPIKEKKEYYYVPDITKSIIAFHQHSSIAMKQKQVIPVKHSTVKNHQDFLDFTNIMRIRYLALV